MRYSYSPEQDFSDWESSRLAKYSSDLSKSTDWRSRRIKKRVDSVLKSRPEDEQDMYVLNIDSKEKLSWFVKEWKNISWNSNFWATTILMGKNNDLYINVINNHWENFQFHIDENMLVEIQDVAKAWDHVWFPFLDPYFSVNKILTSFKTQQNIISGSKNLWWIDWLL